MNYLKVADASQRTLYQTFFTKKNKVIIGFQYKRYLNTKSNEIYIPKKHLENFIGIVPIEYYFTVPNKFTHEYTIIYTDI